MTDVESLILQNQIAMMDALKRLARDDYPGIVSKLGQMMKTTDNFISANTKEE